MVREGGREVGKEGENAFDRVSFWSKSHLCSSGSSSSNFSLILLSMTLMPLLAYLGCEIRLFVL